MVTALVVVTLGLVTVGLVILALLYRTVSKNNPAVLDSRIGGFEKSQERTERVLVDEISRTRTELTTAASGQRQELSGQFKTFGDSVGQRVNDLAGNHKAQLQAFGSKLFDFTQTSGEKLDGVRAELSSAIGKLSEANEKKLEALRLTVEGELKGMKTENAAQLEQMRQTVDEKLQGTLEKRLGESFKQVSERLEQVHKGLGEMQTLASGVGDLKKVLTNVKARGTWGEVQLGALLEQVLTPEQYAKNVATKGTAERVEYAIKLPGQGGESNEIIWLPIDAKFPVEDYQRLIDAQERADVDGMEAAAKNLESRVRSCAKDISDKYLAPPNTTDFGILFLPLEGLFAEIIRRPGLVEGIQQTCRVVIAGPTTLWSILNSLQMGFRTLAIQKRSSEVWNLLAAVKTEWAKYGEVLDAVQKKLNQASDTIEKAKVRSRAIGRKLKDVEELPASDANRLLPEMLPIVELDSGLGLNEEEVGTIS